MRGAGVVSRGRQLGGEVAERLRSHGIEIVPFLTVGCLVAGFWFALSFPTIIQATGLRAEPAREFVRSSVEPKVKLRVTASVGRAAGQTKASRERGETPMPASLRVALR
jgi:hypothetical protein